MIGVKRMIGAKDLIGVKGVTGGIAGRRGPITPPASIFERPRTGPAIRFSGDRTDDAPPADMVTATSSSLVPGI